MGGLKPYLCLVRGARVMLTSNLWVNKGLVNGATGTLRHLIFPQGAAPPTLPRVLIVEMDEGYDGPHLHNKPRYISKLYNFVRIIMLNLIS